MRLSDIGEFGLINRIKKLTRTDPSVVQGIGDDCAVLKSCGNKYQLFTCDMLMEGVDFRSQDDPYLIGRKALAVSLSDIAACSGIPRYSLVSLGVNEKTSVKKIDRLYKGMLDLAKRYKVNIAGGDICRSDKLLLDVSVLGEVEKKNLVLRSRAQTGDIIFVSGTLGGSIKGKHLSFEPRVKEARFLTQNFKVNSMMDISDGLVQDLGHILEASKKGAAIYEELIPLSPEAEDLEEALYMGEDFELLFSLPRLEAKKLVLKRRGAFKPIGEILDKRFGLQLIDKRKNIRPLLSKGFRHF